MKFRQKKRERKNLMSKRKREVIARIYSRARFRVKRGSMLALVVRRMKRGTMGKTTTRGVWWGSRWK